MNKQRGFSLVELVIVIIVVGLLAATALPRFLQVTDEAKKASIEGVAGGFATAVLSARAQWEAYGRPANSSGQYLVDYDGTDFLLTKATTDKSVRDGYPYALTTGNSNVGAINATDCQALLENLLQNPPLATTNSSDAASGNYVFYVKAGTDNSAKLCRYYQLASAGTNGSGSTDVEAGHSFTYKPALGRVEVNLK
ncbi:prepilin-type N-terminal cleavage/methylation domain-containing protein [Photobacterium alginatilyticum]|uniref:Prepilin-type N-terminal cleavage/methylation domain-containing protein n=1 Tax=Photobacterium alginatilyticum TaxID=1775171 RepID=A0ABW9YJA0_9GAMM|nr:prepilin-type N-terminal cleavage/methylation domain-containing protein [Photobacterium alginatilyticum]NBI53627.1 prepilin-type N-terminal cleavage/methylation domain-containing protein [Photobacterium alginatilyticum]